MAGNSECRLNKEAMKPSFTLLLETSEEKFGDLFREEKVKI